mmetsp:Transcript_105272/g.296391  ORF Transcript_105272/g.296391 Transcript_105272/m.296391 type:complete len:567 (-) Transcript_105272:65-1765(-)
MPALPFSCVVGALIACVPVAAHFLAAKGHNRHSHVGDVVASSDIVAVLGALLAKVVDKESPIEAHRRSAIERSISNTFRAVPKNKWGGLEPHAVRHVVHSYFSKQHGWHIDGLEPYGLRLNKSDLSMPLIQRAAVPAAVEALLEIRREGRGLERQDIVVMISMLEQIIFDEAASLLHSTYYLNGFRTDDMLNAAGVIKLLTSYLVIYKQGDEGGADSHADHPLVIQDLQNHPENWDSLQEFVSDAVLNLAHERRFQLNPFTSWRFNIDTALQIVSRLVDAYGQWQNQDCSAMKNEFMRMDVRSTGRVPLKNFYAVPAHYSYSFNEPVAVLRRFDALDESVSTLLKVRVANYITGPLNCVSHSAYYSICCLNECAGIMSDIEGSVLASQASPETLLSLVGNVSSSTIEAPRALPQVLVARLHAIADHHDGTVPLDGRLFAQWLHYAFPHECPFPRLAGGAATPLDKVVEQTGNETMQENDIAQLDFFSKPDDIGADGELIIVEWSNEEELPLRDGQGPKTRAVFRGLFHKAICLPPLLYLLRGALAAAKAASNAYYGLDAASKFSLV